TISRCSITTTLRPHFAAWIAARWPAGPEPMTMMSYFCMGWGWTFRSTRERVLFGVEAAFHFLPVHDVPPGSEIIRPAILILQVVGVLPHVIAKHCRLPVHQWIVLVRRGDDFQPGAGLDDPHPA